MQPDGLWEPVTITFGVSLQGPPQRFSPRQIFWGVPAGPPQRTTPEGAPFGFTHVPQKVKPCNQAENREAASSVPKGRSGQPANSRASESEEVSNFTTHFFDLEVSRRFGQFSLKSATNRAEQGNASRPQHLHPRIGPPNRALIQCRQWRRLQTPIPQGTSTPV